MFSICFLVSLPISASFLVSASSAIGAGFPAATESDPTATTPAYSCILRTFHFPFPLLALAAAWAAQARLSLSVVGNKSSCGRKMGLFHLYQSIAARSTLRSVLRLLRGEVISAPARQAGSWFILYRRLLLAHRQR